MNRRMKHSFHFLLLAAVWLSLALVVTGCGSPDDMDLISLEENRRQDAIIDGNRIDANENPSVGALVVKMNGHQEAFCTGTLIAPDVVLTAAHCLDPIPLFHMTGLTTHFVLTDHANSGVNEAESKFTQYEAHPDYTPETLIAPERIPACNVPQDALDEALCRDLNACPKDNPESMLNCTMEHSLSYISACHRDRPESEDCMDDFLRAIGVLGLSDRADIGLVYLKQPIQTVSPSPVLSPKDSGDLKVGAPVTIVGFGRTTPNGDGDHQGFKMEAQTRLTEVGYAEIKVGNDPTMPQPCKGDSGGPTFMEIENQAPVVIGVTSRSYDNESICNNGGIETRTDVFFPWLDERMVRACKRGLRKDCEGHGSLVPPNDPLMEVIIDGDDVATGCSSVNAAQNMLPVWLILLGGMIRRVRPYLRD